MIENDDLSAARIVSGAPASQQEEALERALRPRLLDEYVGQEKVRGQLSIFIEAARKRKEPLDHVLLFGPPGLGKTTLAHIIAREMGVNLRHTSGPVLERAGDRAADPGDGRPSGRSEAHLARPRVRVRAHETRHDLVCRLLLEKKKKKNIVNVYI